MTFGERLRQLREERHLTQQEVADWLGVSRQTIFKYENGIIGNMKRTDIQILADKFDVAPSYLLAIEGAVRKIKRTIKVYGSIPAGVPMEMIEDIEGEEDIPSKFFDATKEYFGLKVKGNSMFPRYQDGDILICEKTDTCETGDDCIVAVNGDEATFKRVNISENGIVLQPLNPEYEPLVFSNDQVKSLPIKIIGVVRELRRKIK
jgi:repressor LexA